MDNVHKSMYLIQVIGFVTEKNKQDYIMTRDLILRNP